jgi:membrane-bound metal-dependent hydrolase YbcI (DUF457 family)
VFAIGHFALGYLAGKGTSKFVKVKVNMPLLLAAAVLPDVDLILRFLMHRGPTHSLIFLSVLMVPFFVIYRRQALPYYAAVLSHVLIGDFFTGGVQLFWPFSNNFFGAVNLSTIGLTSVVLELLFFFLALPIMYKSGDLASLLRPHNKNWVLIIPFTATLGPLLTVGRGLEASLPLLLVVPSLFFLVLFAYALLIEIRAK